VISKLRARQEWQFFAVLPRASMPLAVAWWLLLVARGALPAIFAVAMGRLIGTVQQHGRLAGPLVLVGVTFVLLQVLMPVHQAVSSNLGSKVAAWLNDELARSCVGPPGIGHLEDASLTEDLEVAREFDRGQTGPPMYLNVDFAAGGLVELFGGVACAVVLFGFNWWAPLVLVAAWGSTHWLLRESGVWRDRNTGEVRSAQRHASYAYQLAVDPEPAKELRMFGLADWAVQRFVERRRRLFALQYEATRLREKPLAWCLLVVAVANGVVFWALATEALDGRIGLDGLITYAQLAIGVAMIAFGGLNWVLDGAAAPVVAVRRLRAAMAPAGALTMARAPAALAPGDLRIRGVSFGYPGVEEQVFDGLDLTVPAGTSLAVVGRNGAGKTTLAKLLCRLYDPDSGSIEMGGVDLRDVDLEAWRAQVTAVFQDFVRFELPLRNNVAPGGASDEDILAALADAGADGLAELDTPLAKGYDGGTDLSGGQWQRVALARALCAVRQGAGLVLLDEPTAQLDVRGEAKVFDRVLSATRGVTTILISHRFSTVRQADRICVLEQGRVLELGSHDELMALNGRYRTMFDLQARRFTAETDEEGVSYDVL
jgi:ABC-type multidrug transport system fused ATPase/permease subunit